MKVVVAIDSFKGSISSIEAGESARIGIKKVFPSAAVKVFSIADGGEGTLESLACLSKTKKVFVNVRNPLGQKIKSEYLLLNKTTAVIELAKSSGLTLIDEKKRNPLKTSTYGLGELIKNALENGVKNFIVGLGGSATNDAGIGMLAALGYKFFTKNGKEIKTFGGENLIKIFSIDSSGIHKKLNCVKFTILCDVSNPFCGKKGAAYVFSPQKGANELDVELLDKGLCSFAKVTKKFTKKDIKNSKGAGAAGGIGGAFMAYMNATFKNGITGILDAINFDKSLQNADYVITGEGRLDSQTCMGKVPWGVANRAKKFGVKVIALGGGITNDADKLYQNNISAMFATSKGPSSLEDAMMKKNATSHIAFVSENIFRVIKAIKKT